MESLVSYMESLVGYFEKHKIDEMQPVLEKIRALATKQLDQTIPEIEARDEQINANVRELQAQEGKAIEDMPEYENITREKIAIFDSFIVPAIEIMDLTKLLVDYLEKHKIKEMQPVLEKIKICDAKITEQKGQIKQANDELMALKGKGKEREGQ